MTNADTETDPPTVGKDGTIPNTPDGIAIGRDPRGSNFNPEEDPPKETVNPPESEEGSTDADN